MAGWATDGAGGHFMEGFLLYGIYKSLLDIAGRKITGYQLTDKRTHSVDKFKDIVSLVFLTNAMVRVWNGY